MRKTSPKNRKRKNVQASFTRAELAKMHRTDARAISRRCQALGVEELPRAGQTEAVSYMLTPDQVKRLGEPLPRGAAQYAGSSDLHQEKLKEEVERLKLRNSTLRNETTPNSELSRLFGELATSTATILTQKLEIENPVQTAGLEADEIREINRKFKDEICARWDSEADRWAKYRRD